MIKESLKYSFLSILKNKKTFLLIFALQLIFFFLITSISVIYMTKIVENSKNILDYTENLDLNTENMQLDVLQQKNFLGDDPLLVSRNYNDIIRNFAFFTLYSFLIFVLVNGLAWYFALNINIKKSLFSVKNIFPYLCKFFVVSIALFLVLFIFLYSLLEMSFNDFLNTNPKSFVPLLIASATAVYFICISIPLINKFKSRDLAKKAFFTGTRKFIPMAFSYLMILVLIALSSFSVFYFLESNWILLSSSLILMVFIFAWSKVYFAVLVGKLSGL